jgi:hypothetical protein
MKFPVVVEMTPLIFELSTKLFVLVDMVKTLVVPALITDCKFVVVATPLIVEVSIVPATERLLELIIGVEDIDPPRLEVMVFTLLERVLGTDKFVVVKFVVVALVAVKFVKKPVTTLSKLVKRLVVVALVTVKFSAVVLPVSMRLFNCDMVAVVVTPFTALVKTFVAVLKLLVLELMIIALEATPFTVVVKLFTSVVI